MYSPRAQFTTSFDFLKEDRGGQKEWRPRGREEIPEESATNSNTYTFLSHMNQKFYIDDVYQLFKNLILGVPARILNSSQVCFFKHIQWVLVYREFVYRDPRNTGIFLMVTINLEYQDFPGFSRKNSNTGIFPGKSRYTRLTRLISEPENSIIRIF